LNVIRKEEGKEEKTEEKTCIKRSKRSGKEFAGTFFRKDSWSLIGTAENIGGKDLGMGG
jgi:hypothetical protein